MSEVKITPLARRLAEENGIDWRQIKGTGPDGTVVERDILAFLAKVMAGEVNLPPAPEEVAPPPSAVPNMAQAQAALEKEGVQLGDLVPSSPAAPPPPAESALPTLEDIEFDLDLEPTPPPVPPAAAAFEEAPTLAPEPEIVPNFDEPEPLVAPEPLPALQWEEPEPFPAEPAAKMNPEQAELPLGARASASREVDRPPLPSETDLEPAGNTQKLIWETQEVLSAPAPSPLGFSNTPAAEPPVQVPPPPEEPTPATTPAEEIAAPPPWAAPAPATPLRVQAWQRLVETGPAQEAAQTLSEAWRMEVGLDALLYRAADKALSDTQSPLRPTKGILEGDTLKSLRVAPSQSLRGALDSLNMASDPAEGLTVLSLVDSAFDQVIFPGLATLTLGRASGGHALLTLSGDISSELAGRLLERVAYYLEHPILLA